MKKSIVLFTTLLLIMTLLSVIMIFLKQTTKTKDTISLEYAKIQTNLTMYNLAQYFKKVKFDEQTIFYGAKVPFRLEFGKTLVTFQFNSANGKVNINNLLTSLKTKDNIVYDNFISYLYQHNVKDPEFLVDILLDTIDKDDIELNSGSGSEIVLVNPIFKNGKIYNIKHFNDIIKYYSAIAGDRDIFDVEFDSIISFDASGVDLNFASQDVLKFLFYDANDYSLTQIAKHSKVYEKLSELPFDDYYLKDIKKGRMGNSIGVSTSILDVDVTINMNGKFISKVSFLYNVKKNTLFDYTVNSIVLDTK